MAVNFFKSQWIIVILSALLLVLTFNSCQQYDYSSPTPGTIELKLRAYYNSFDTSFALNNFTLKVTSVYTVRSDGAVGNIYQDVKSIGGSANLYNALGHDAYDSLIVLGRYPLPPADYTTLGLSIEPGPDVLLDGYRDIIVQRLPAELYTASVVIPKHFSIQEAKTTTIVLMVNLDRTLRRLAYTFEYDPFYYTISSVTVH